jgi:hypothetical protein
MSIRLPRTLPRTPTWPVRELKTASGELDKDELIRYLRDQNSSLIELQREHVERITAAHNLPSFRVHRNGVDQVTIANNTLTKIQFNSIATTAGTAEGFDDWAYFDLATNYRYLPKIAGVYHFGLQVRFKTVAAATSVVGQISKGGGIGIGTVGASRVIAPGVVSPIAFVSTICRMNGKDEYVEFYCLQDSGGAQDLNGGAIITLAWGCKLSDY